MQHREGQMGYEPWPRRKQRLGGALIAVVGIVGTIGVWHTALTEGRFRVVIIGALPAFVVMGLALVAMPGYREERIARGEDISGMSGAELITPRWWLVLVLALVAGIGNIILLKHGFDF